MRRQKLEYSAYVLALTAALSCAPTTLFAAPPDKVAPESVSATVSLADLDLNTPAGLSTARARLSTQAQKLCRRFIDDRKISSWETYADCTRDTLASALQRLNESARVARR